MVWGMIFANGNIWLEWLKGRQNSESNKQLLDEKALPTNRKQLIETRRDVIVHMFDHYEERLIEVIEKKVDITDY